MLIKEKLKISITKTIISLLVFLPLTSFSQKNLSEISNEIKFNGDTLKDIFCWVTSNIEYDIEKSKIVFPYFEIDDSRKIIEVINSKKGICSDYALIFNELCKKYKFESYIVAGITSQSNKIGHAWNVVKMKGHWYCFDPTWSAGKVWDNTFKKEYDSTWYKVEPSEFIQTHFPLDPIWQLSNQPVYVNSSNETVKSGDYYNFEDSILVDNQVDKINSIQYSIIRIEKYNITKNELVKKYVNILKQNLNQKSYNNAIEMFNKGVGIFNLYINYKNKRFLEPKLKDSEIQALINSANKTISESRAMIDNLIFNKYSFVNDTKSKLLEIEKRLDEETLFTNKYLQTKKTFRVFLFYKKLKN